MIVLHAAQVAHELFLWAEQPVDTPAPARKRGRSARTSRANPLPFGAGTKAITGTLAGVLGENWAATRDVQRLTISIPARDGRPIASTPLVAEPPQEGSEIVMSKWTVEALRLSPTQATQLLGECLDRETLGPGVLIARDLRFWAGALRFASALVARQQFLPGLARLEDGWYARWEPVVGGVDADRLQKLAAVMPHSARALTSDPEVPPASPSAALTAFLTSVVDHIVRSGLPSAALPPLPAPRRRRIFDSTHDQWMHALHEDDGFMLGGHDEIEKLAADIRSWRLPLQMTEAAPVKLCFRLEEPPEPDGRADAEPPGRPKRTARKREDLASWFVRFLLQPAADPSLLVEASDIWKDHTARTVLLPRGDSSPREYLLAALGQAAGICPRIEACLNAAEPSGYPLDTAGASEFLTEKAAALEQSGFVVMAPAWWTGRGTKLRLAARARVAGAPLKSPSGLTLDAVVGFDWEVALGDATLSRAELEALAKLKAPLVRLRGQWVQLSADQIRAAVDLWKNGGGQMRVRDIVRMGLGAAAPVAGVEIQSAVAEGWIGELLAQLDGSAPYSEFGHPEGFEGRLRPYQLRGYSWLAFLRRWGLGACLADDMGLGKTIQVLALIQRDWRENRRAPVLLICPTSVTGNWQKEAERFTPDLPVLVHHGTERMRGAAFRKQAARHALVVSSYPLLHRDFDLFKDVAWGAIVLDEAQNIKNPETKQARCARSLQADCRIALTGTPVENNVGDLWSIMEFLNPGYLGTNSDFKRRFFLPIQVDKDPHAVERLKRLTGPFILRRLKTDKTVIADLPDKLEMKVYCPLTKEQASLYAAVVRDAEQELDGAEGIQRKGLVLATLMKLKQACNHPAQLLGDGSQIPGRSGKLARLTEMLDEMILAGDCALVFTQFAEMGAILQRYLQETFGREILFLHGATPKKQRDAMVARFQGDGEAPPVFLLSLKAGGTGLNLTRASHVFHFDRWWNPAVENQATDRAFRIGQTRNVQVHKFICQGTVEERIDEMIERKSEISARVVGTGEGWLTELSTSELKELFALRDEAVQE
ncbi:MAG: DEAD/DEAH box helicase [Acidobacteriota bacterium]